VPRTQVFMLGLVFFEGFLRRPMFVDYADAVPPAACSVPP